MRSKPIASEEEKQQLKTHDLTVKKTPLTEKGIIQPFPKRQVNNDTCGINRDKNQCGDASEY